MKKVVLLLLVLIMCVSCLEIPKEEGEHGIGHLERLIYDQYEEVEYTQCVCRFGVIFVRGHVVLPSRFSSNYWIYVNETKGTARFTNNRTSNMLDIVYPLMITKILDGKDK